MESIRKTLPSMVKTLSREKERGKDILLLGKKLQLFEDACVKTFVCAKEHWKKNKIEAFKDYPDSFLITAYWMLYDSWGKDHDLDFIKHRDFLGMKEDSEYKAQGADMSWMLLGLKLSSIELDFKFKWFLKQVYPIASIDGTPTKPTDEFFADLKKVEEVFRESLKESARRVERFSPYEKRKWAMKEDATWNERIKALREKVADFKEKEKEDKK